MCGPPACSEVVSESQENQRRTGSHQCQPQSFGSINPSLGFWSGVAKLQRHFPKIIPELATMQQQLPGPMQPEILTPGTPTHMFRLQATDHSMPWPYSTRSPKVALTQSRLPWAPWRRPCPYHVEQLLQQPVGRGTVALQDLVQVGVADALLEHLLCRACGVGGSKHACGPRANSHPAETPEEAELSGLPAWLCLWVTTRAGAGGCGGMQGRGATSEGCR